MQGTHGKKTTFPITEIVGIIAQTLIKRRLFARAVQAVRDAQYSIPQATANYTGRSRNWKLKSVELPQNQSWEV